MKTNYSLFLALLLLMGSCSAPKQTDEESDEVPERIITAGGTLTEVVYSLGFGDRIIATDITSTYPASMQDLPSIGYRNQIKSEGILSLGPELVLVEEGYLNEEVVAQLESSGIRVQLFPKPKNLEETRYFISNLAKFFEAEEAGNELISAIEEDQKALSAFLSEQNTSPSAAFIMARGPQTVFLAGDETFSAEMFKMAGIQSVSTGFKDFIPLTPEALVAINPDYLVLFESGIESLGGKEGLAGVQGIKETEAFKNDRILVFDGHYLSAFGPRAGKAALELAKATRP
ncbi:heme/hemin ABC transporter substrate-binding protein [Algoriphagus confluentis]|uniref:Hemin ABC transporter substrate-binding protein n=1 Tax=Algoriphagus confluentis TaxID=1697556 RepID=A0ABQ6PLL6_9BACT|nr:hemin ABC transporter substrate-binding protein [Algoriphagus confluentis]